VFVTIGDPKTFNPVLANEVSSTDITSGPLFVGLTTFANGPQKVEPGIASSWDVSEDGLEYTFHLRQGLRWSDGEPLDADDVIFTSQVGLDPKIHSGDFDILQTGGKPWKFEKVDSVTVKVVLPAPFGPVVDVIGSMYLVPRHKLEAAYKAGKFEEMWGVNTPPSEIGRDRAVHGPVVRQGVTHHARAEPALLGGRQGRHAPALPRRVRVPDRQGPEHHGAQVPERRDRRDRPDPGRPGAAVRGRRGEGRLPRVRPRPGRRDRLHVVQPQSRQEREGQVLRRAVEAQDLRRRPLPPPCRTRSIARHRQVGAAGPRGPLYTPYTSSNKVWYDPNVPKFAYDPAKAKALLDEMGLKDTNGDGIRDTPDGHPVEFTLHTNSENNLRKAFGTVIADNLTKVGIRVNFQPLEFNTLIVRLREDFEYEAILLGLSSAVPPDPALSTNVYRSSGLTHNWYVKQKSPATPAEAEMDKLMNQVVQERDFAKRKAAFDRVQEIMGENQFCIYVVNRNLYVGLRNRVQGSDPSVLRPHATWNIQEIWLKGRGGSKLASAQ
jgi:peptide/nickel transport system substrate-binding protein